MSTFSAGNRYRFVVHMVGNYSYQQEAENTMADIQANVRAELAAECTVNDVQVRVIDNMVQTDYYNVAVDALFAGGARNWTEIVAAAVRGANLKLNAHSGERAFTLGSNSILPWAPWYALNRFSNDNAIDSAVHIPPGAVVGPLLSDNGPSTLGTLLAGGSTVRTTEPTRTAENGSSLAVVVATTGANRVVENVTGAPPGEGSASLVSTVRGVGIFLAVVIGIVAVGYGAKGIASLVRK